MNDATTIAKINECVQSLIFDHKELYPNLQKMTSDGTLVPILFNGNHSLGTDLLNPILCKTEIISNTAYGSTHHFKPNSKTVALVKADLLQDIDAKLQNSHIKEKVNLMGGMIGYIYTPK